MNAWQTIRLVAGRELGLRIRGRAFRFSTLVTVLLVIGVIAAPTFFPGDDETDYQLALIGDTPAELRPAIEESAALLNVRYSLVEDIALQEAEDAVLDGDVDAAIVNSATVILKNDNDDRLRSLVGGALRRIEQSQRLREAGLDPEKVAETLGAAPDFQERILEPDRNNDDPQVGFFAVAAMFGAILLYSQWVMSGVLEEKSSRVVEVILGAVTPRRLMAGKVLGIGSLGLLQLAILAAAGGAAAVATGSGLPQAGVTAALTAMFWFLLGFSFYAVLSAVAAALVSRQEDLQVAFLPVMGVAMTSYMFAFATSQNPEGSVARIGSLVPTVAPFLMPARAAQSSVPLTEQAAAAGLMVLSIWALAVVGARIYSGAILRFGPRTKLREAWKRT